MPSRTARSGHLPHLTLRRFLLRHSRQYPRVHPELVCFGILLAFGSFETPPGTSPTPYRWYNPRTRPRLRPARFFPPRSTSPAWSRDTAGPWGGILFDPPPTA